MSIPQYIAGLSESQLSYAKTLIEERQKAYKEAKKIKFACISDYSLRYAWIDCRDKEGWKRLWEKYLDMVDESFAIVQRDAKFNEPLFKETFPSIEFLEVNELEYASWLEDSLNPEFKAEETE